jgi:hypothetical protein
MVGVGFVLAVGVTSAPTFVSELQTLVPAVPAVLPPLDVPALDVPPLDVPALDVPPLDVPALDVPALDVPALDVPPLDVPPLDVPALDVPALPTPALEDPALPALPGSELPVPPQPCSAIMANTAIEPLYRSPLIFFVTVASPFLMTESRSALRSAFRR